MLFLETTGTYRIRLWVGARSSTSAITSTARKITQQTQSPLYWYFTHQANLDLNRQVLPSTSTFEAGWKPAIFLNEGGWGFSSPQMLDALTRTASGGVCIDTNWTGLSANRPIWEEKMKTDKWNYWIYQQLGSNVGQATNLLGENGKWRC